MRAVSIRIQSVEVKAKCRPLGHVRQTVRRGRRKFNFIKKWTWTLETPRDLKMTHGLNTMTEHNDGRETQPL